MKRLEGKSVLITGGTSGIGLETARQFLAEGARVAVTGIDGAGIEKARKELGSDVIALQADAASLDAQQKLTKTLKDAFGQLDILHINAGIAEFRPLEKWDEVGFDRQMAINFKGPYFLVQALLPIFAKPASIVLTASINANIGMTNSSVYAASKAALLSLARTLSGELVDRGIRVNAVSPGPIATPIHGRYITPEELEKTADWLTTQIPMHRFGEPAEIAKAVVFLASDESAFTIGSELIIDGGMSTL